MKTSKPKCPERVLDKLDRIKPAFNLQGKLIIPRDLLTIQELKIARCSGALRALEQFWRGAYSI